MSEDEKQAAERAASYLAAKMPAWWRPEFQKAATFTAPEAPPTAAATTDASATVPPAPRSEPPPPPQPPAAVVPPPAQTARPVQSPAAHEAKTMVLGVPSAPPVAILTVTAGPDIGFKFRIRPTVVTRIGREADNDVVLDDHATSRRHAQIQFQDGKFVLTDLGSANGTLVNDQRVTEQTLSDGDMIRIGQDVIQTSIVG
jgi:pSer/pThr/pTyr-binding forkhead associated (FHA) protein